MKFLKHPVVSHHPKWPHTEIPFYRKQYLWANNQVFMLYHCFNKTFSWKNMMFAEWRYIYLCFCFLELGPTNLFFPFYHLFLIITGPLWDQVWTAFHGLIEGLILGWIMTQNWWSDIFYCQTLGKMQCLAEGAINMCLLLCTQSSDHCAATGTCLKNLLALFIWQFHAEVNVGKWTNSFCSSFPVVLFQVNSRTLAYFEKFLLVSTIPDQEHLWEAS